MKSCFYFILALVLVTVNSYRIGNCNVDNGGCHVDAICENQANGVPICTCKPGKVGNGALCGGLIPPNDTYCDTIVREKCYRDCCPFHYNCAEWGEHPTYF